MKKITKIEGKKIKDIRNLLDLKKKDSTTIKNIRIILRLKKEIADTSIKDKRNLFRLKNRKRSN